MKSLILCFVLSCSISVWSQTKKTTSSTGRVATSEDQYNEQMEKCKVGSVSNPLMTSTPSSSSKSSSSKVKER